MLQAIVRELKDPIKVATQLGASTADPRHAASLVTRSAALAAKLDGKRGLTVQVLLASILHQVTVQEDAVQLAFNPTALGKELGFPPQAVTADGMDISIPVRIRRSGLAVRFVLQSGAAAAPGSTDQHLLAGIAKGRAWWKRLEAETSMTVTDLAKAEGLAPAYVDRILRLAFLSPTTVNAILDGTAPTDLNLERLKDVKCIAPSWAMQHRLLGVAAARG